MFGYHYIIGKFWIAGYRFSNLPKWFCSNLLLQQEELIDFLSNEISSKFFKNSAWKSNRHRLIYNKNFDFIYKWYWFLPFSSLVNWIGIRWIMLKYNWLPKCMGWGNQWNNSCKISWNHILMAYDSDFWFTHYRFWSLCWRYRYILKIKEDVNYGVILKGTADKTGWS